MKQKLFFLMSFLVSQAFFAQQVKILNSETNEPIPDVALYNESKSKSSISDSGGNASIAAFGSSEMIYFQHTAYITASFTKEQIQNNNLTVLLRTDTGKLDEVIISVSKFEQDKRDIPQKVVTITTEDVAFTNPQTGADLLINSGQVFVQKSQLGGGSPMIRGFATNRLLMTVDGVRMNTAIFRGGNIQNILSIDPFVVEKTEVILGPGSVAYGSDAVGGVMNFYTLKPKFSLEDRMSFSGNAVARFSTANEEKTGHVDFNLGFKEWAFLTSISYNDFGDLRMGKYGPDDYVRNFYITTANGEDTQVPNDKPLVQVPTGYNQVSVAQKVRFMPDDNWDFSANFLFSTTSDYSRYDRLTRERNGNLRDAEWYYGPQLWFSGNLQAEKKGTDTFYDNARFIVAYQHFEESRNNRSVGSANFFNTEEKVDAYSANLDFTKNLGDNKLFYGVEYVYNKVNSTGEQTDINTGETSETAARYPNGSTWQSMAAYASFQWKWSPQFSFVSGLRYSHFMMDATFDNRFYNFPFETASINTGNLTGSAGIAWQPSEILGWRANFSTAFRAPNVDDIGKIFDSEPGAVVVPNPDLKAEYAYTGEIGVTLNFENVVKVDVAGFYTKLENALVRRPFHLNGETEIDYQGELSTVLAIQNAADARVYGVEANVEVNFCRTLKLTSHYNVTTGYEELDNGEQAALRHAPPQFGNTRLIYNNNRFRVDAFVVYSGQFDNDDLAPSEAGKPEIYATDVNGNLYSPSWYTLNIASQYKIADQWQAGVSLENITDQRYRTYSSGIASSGRNLILSLKYSF